MRYYWLLAILLAVSCQESDLPVAVHKTSDMSVPKLYEPYDLPNILGAKGAYVEARFDGAKSEVPKVDINLRVGIPDSIPLNYEIQRCHAGVKLETASGVDPITKTYPPGTEEMKQEEYLYVWGMAAAGACTQLGRRHSTSPFVDDFNTEEIGGTGSFNFFYLVRPCLNAGNSIYNKRRTCSYAFARTNSIEGYVNDVAKENMQLIAKLAAQRSRLEHRMMQMASVIRQKAHYIQQCEFKEARDNASKRRLAGLAKVALITGAVVAAVASGGTAIFLAGSVAAQLGDKMFAGFSNATLNCPTGVYDKKNKDILADVEKTIEKIGVIRSGLGELDLEGKKRPSLEEAIRKTAGKECEQIDGLGKDCLGT